MNNFITLIFFKLSSVSGGLMLLLIFFLLYFNYVTNIESLFFSSQPSLMMLWYFFRVFFFFWCLISSRTDRSSHIFSDGLRHLQSDFALWFDSHRKIGFFMLFLRWVVQLFLSFFFCFYCYMFSNSYTTRRGCVLWFEWSMWCAFELPLKYSSFFLCNFFDTLIQSHGLEFSALGQGDDFLDL